MSRSIDRSSFARDYQFVHAVYELLQAKAKRLTGEELNFIAAETKLNPTEFDTLLLITFEYSWDNNGSFIDTVKWYDEEFDQVDRAFRRMGFNTASLLMPRARKLYDVQTPYLAEDLPLPADVKAEVDQINNAASADAGEDRLAKAIAERSECYDS